MPPSVRRLLLPLLTAATLLATGCNSGQRFYLEPKYRGITAAQIQPPPAPIPVVLTVRGETNGEPAAGATAFWSYHVKRALTESHSFAVADDDTPSAAHLTVTINNLSDTAAAFGQGVRTSLTLGTLGGTVTDRYVMTAEFTGPKGRTFEQDYRHAIYTTRGHTHPPVDDAPVPGAQAPILVTDDLVLHLLKDLGTAGFFRPSSSPTPMPTPHAPTPILATGSAR